jgi:hypothetical protein
MLYFLCVIFLWLFLLKRFALYKLPQSSKKKENCTGSMLQVYTKTGGSFLKGHYSEGALACRLPQRTGLLPKFMDVLPVFFFFLPIFTNLCLFLPI